MADIETRFKVFLQTDATIEQKVGDRIHFDQVPEDKKRPYIWARLSRIGNFETLDSSAGEVPGEYQFDLECVSPVKSEARTIAEAVRAKCHCHRGTFADTTVRGMFTTDQDEDYVPLGVGEGTGLFVDALGVQVFS